MSDQHAERKAMHTHPLSEDLREDARETMLMRVASRAMVVADELDRLWAENAMKDRRIAELELLVHNDGSPPAS